MSRTSGKNPKSTGDGVNSIDYGKDDTASLPQKGQKTLWPYWLIVILCLCPLPVLPIGEQLVVGRSGSRWFQVLQAITVLGCAATPLVFVAGISMLFLAERRAFGVRLLFAAAIYFPAMLAGMRLKDSIRTQAFERLAERSAPLVNAIEKYETEKGLPPSSLEALVPDYLPGVPTTGMAAYPDYIYFSDESEAFDGNP